MSVLAGLSAACASEAPPQAGPESTGPGGAGSGGARSEGVWVSIFDGETLDGWTPKIAGHPLGENFAGTYYVEDGAIKTTYAGYGDDFDQRYGNLFYETPHDHYRLRLEYRFTGEQAPGAEDWARLNSGVLYHAQPPGTVPLDSGFPVALEAQFLAEGAHAPTTGNMCSLETYVTIDGAPRHEHCIGGPVPSRPLGEWVRFELHAAPDGTFRHYIDGELAFAFTAPFYDAPHAWADGMTVEGGYFSLQSESHPVEFRGIELMVLDGDG